MAQYIKTYEKGRHLINLDYVKEMFTRTFFVDNIPHKELVFIDNTDNVIFCYKGQTNEYIDTCFEKIQNFIAEQKDVVYHLY